jgi:hypothetical protein
MRGTLLKSLHRRSTVSQPSVPLFVPSVTAAASARHVIHHSSSLSCVIRRCHRHLSTDPCCPMQCPHRAILPGNMTDVPDAAAARPAVQPANRPRPTHGHPGHQLPPLGNISDIPDADPSCPTHPLDLKLRIKYLQIRGIMHIQECGWPAYP